MATPDIAQSYEESIQRSTVDVKVPTTLELPVDDWPQQVTDILSPDLIIGEADSPARQLGHENDVVGMISSSTPVVAVSTETSTNLLATTEATLNTGPNDSLPSTPESSLHSTPETSLPSTSDSVSPKVQVALSLDDDFILCEKPVDNLALRILDIIQRYGHSTGAGTDVDWAGKNKFLPVVEQSIEKDEPVKMVLPAFPCVSVFNCCPF